MVAAARAKAQALEALAQRIIEQRDYSCERSLERGERVGVVILGAAEERNSWASAYSLRDEIDERERGFGLWVWEVRLRSTWRERVRSDRRERETTRPLGSFSTSRIHNLSFL